MGNSVGRRILACRIILCCAAVLMLTGCGKKGPPVAPQHKPLAAVADLKADLNKGLVRLTWSHDPENWGAAKYLVLRAQMAMTQPECPDCPMVFQKVGAIPLSKALRHEKHTLDFSQNLMPGFRYTFHVRPIHDAGVQGPDSNSVVIEMPE